MSVIHSYNDTICAPATILGTGAISIIRISGPRTHEILDSILVFKQGKASDKKGYSLHKALLGELDEVMVALFRSPASYTGEDAAEIYCHASQYIGQRAIELLCESGCRLAEPGEFTRRAFLSGKMDLAQAEAVADVIASQSAEQHRIAMNQLRGGYSRELSSIREELVSLAALMELELDFSEEELEFADRARLYELAQSSSAKCQKLAESFSLGNAIKSGIPIAIVGAPNSGKSTLLNTLLKEERAIVSDIAGTTRDTVEECCVIGGLKYRFIDTAGIHHSEDKVERMGIERSINKIKEARIVLLVVDPSDSYADEDIQTILNEVDGGNQRIIVLENKCDLMVNKSVTSANKIVSLAENKGLNPVIIKCSAKYGDGIEQLLSELSKWGSLSVTSDTLVTNARHAEALKRASQQLGIVRDALLQSSPYISNDLLAEDLRIAITSLGEITGEIDNDEILGKIFTEFCIGK